MEIFHSIVLGVVQGITEFLPISSSAHLVLLPYLFSWKDLGLSFDVALHFGTAIAIIAYFWKDWINIFAKAFGRNSQVIKDEAEDSYPSNFLWQIVIASIPAAIFGTILDKAAENYFHSSMILIAIDLVIFGILLWAVDKYAKKSQNTEKINYGQSFLVGLSQSIALVPGVSRSGITMITSRALGLDREKAARFSFLLATPATLGAFLFKLKDMSAADFNAAFISGVIFSTIFGLLTIKYLLNYLKKGSFSVFMWYRIILAAVVLTVYFAR